MKENPEEQNEIRQYLLGRLDDEAKMRQIEEKILLDDDYAEKLSVAENELIEEHLSGNLSRDEQKAFTEIFLAAPQRKKHLRMVENLHKYAAQSQNVREFPKEKKALLNWRDWFAMPVVRAAFAVLVVCVIGFAVWRAGFYESDVDKGLAQMKIAYRGQRPVEPRLTTDFDYAPFITTRGGKEGEEEPQTVTDDAARKRARNILEPAADNSPDARAHHALGLLYLAEKNYDEALKELKLASESAPDNAEIYSDLGALYLEKARRAEIDKNKKSDEFIANASLSLENLDRALKIKDSLKEAQFNKALILQRMMLINEAREAWQKYLEKDSNSDWANEARRRLEELNEQGSAPKDQSRILQDFLEAFRRRDDVRAWEIASQTKELVTGVMISGQLARKFLEAGNDESRKEERNEILSAFDYLGELERQNSGDLYFAELAGYYSKTNESQQETLRQAHKEMEAGYSLITEPDFERAAEVFRRAEDLFSSAGNDWEMQIAGYQIAYTLAQITRLEESNKILLAMADVGEKKNYEWQKAIAYGWLGSNYSSLSDHSKALEYNHRALETAEKISDTYNIHRAYNQLANEYQKVGNYPQALTFAHRTLIPNSYYLSPRQKFRNLNFATQVLIAAKSNAAAVAFARENVNFVQNEARNEWLTHSARIQLGTVYSQIGKYPEAYREFESSLEIARNLSDQMKGGQLAARSFLSLANVQRQAGECGAAIESYNQAIRLYETMPQLAVNNYETRKGRLLCFVAQKNDSAFREEISALLGSFDGYRQKLKENERNTFFSAEQSVYDAAVDYAYSNFGDNEQAFNYAENSRARSLLNLVRKDSSSSSSVQLPQPVSLSEVQRRLPVGVQMVYYAALPNKILIWYISGSDFKAFEQPLKQGELENKIAEYRKILLDRRDLETTRAAAKELYKLLIEPVEPLLVKDKTVCLVADKSLFRLPFASLVTRSTGKYLIEDYALLLAPSASVFLDETELAGKRATAKNENILSIGSTAFSRRENPKLEDLPFAVKEARQVASFYEAPARKVFVAENAVKKHIVESFAEADVVHFVGHYVRHAQSAAASKLLLAADAADEKDGALSIEEIMQNQLPQTRLIVLSACETGVEKFYHGEGMIGAARAFLAAGIPLVVASQWSVDSTASAELMIRFHRYRKQNGLPTTAALRQAQIDLLSDEKLPFRQPFYWAGFLPIGGYADY